MFSKQSNNKTDEYDWALVFGKFEQDLLEENTEADIESFSDDENSQQYTDNVRDNVQVGGQNCMIHKITEDKTIKKQSRRKSNSRNRSTTRVANKQNSRNNPRILSADHIQKTDKEETST